MKSGWYLGRLAGIKIYVHWTFLILLGWIMIAYYRQHNSMHEAWLGVGFIILLFFCVFLHELGHALTARRFQVTTKSITILPIGGLASMEKMPEKPLHELLVAIAGPLVNFVIAAVLYVYLHATGGFPTLEELQTMQGMSADKVVLNLFYANLILGLFNLVPAFPMDGGRILRSLLAMKMDKTRATDIAAGIGRFLAVMFIFFGIFFDFWLVFIGIFIYLGAGAENAQQATRSLLEGVKVGAAMITDYKTLFPTDTIKKAADLLLHSQDNEFLVMDINNERAVGVLTRENIIKGLAESGPDTRVQEVMNRSLCEVTEEMPLEDVYRKMLTENIRVCPVYRGTDLIGIIDQENIQELILVLMARQRQGDNTMLAGI